MVEDDDGRVRGDHQWTLGSAQRFFARPQPAGEGEVLSARVDHDLQWRDVSFAVRPGLTGLATMVSGQERRVGVVLAHGGSDDGHRFFVDEAAQLARRGATVVLPVTRFPPHAEIGEVAEVVRDAVLTELCAVDLLVGQVGPAARLCFLGHSAGGFLGAYLSALEPRLSRVAIFGYGVGTFTRLALHDIHRTGRALVDSDRKHLQWLEPTNYVQVDNARQLMIQQGRYDTEVPMSEGRALFAAAVEPKRWAEYDCGHAIDADPRARADRAAFVFA